mmetsp:Transcript_32647/g.76638  ORF Transcript_32647/g.76638 Transcript_32647/m.76638 type:complete len:182 (+) Transcript_32647:1-546(+)
MRTNEEPGPYAFRVDTRFVQIRASNAEGNFATVPGSEEPIFMVPGQPDKPPETTFGIEGMGVNVFLQQDLDKRSNQRFVYAKRAFKPAPDVPEESVKARVCAVAATRAAASVDAAARDRGKRQAPDKSLGRDKKSRLEQGRAEKSGCNPRGDDLSSSLLPANPTRAHGKRKTTDSTSPQDA